MIIRHTESLTDQIYQDSLALRYEVFVAEQGVPEELELEGEAGCIYFTLYKEEKAVATCRLLKKANQVAKLQRMAVSRQARQLNLGRQIMTAAEELAKKQGFRQIILGAQESAIGFYEKLGYTTYGEQFLDANIPHYMMEKTL